MAAFPDYIVTLEEQLMSALARHYNAMPEVPEEDQPRDPQTLLALMREGKSWQMDAAELAAILVDFDKRLKVLESKTKLGAVRERS